VGPALPAIQRAFGVDARASAWIFTIYILFNLVSVPLMSKLSDQFGRRSIYVLDVALFAAGSLIVALSPESQFSVLLFGRAVQGFGAGGIFPVASAVIGDTFPPEKRGSALGLIGAVFGLAFLIGPVLSGVLLVFLTWHWLFVVNLPIAAVVIFMALRTLPARRSLAAGPFDLPGMAVLGLLLAGLTYGINQLDTTHVAASLASLNVWPFLLGALLLAVLFVAIERRAANPVIRIGLFGSRQISVVSLLAAGAGIGESAVGFVPALLVAAYSVKLSQASFMLLPAVLAMGVGSPLAGRSLDRFGSRVVLLAGSLLVALGLFVLAPLQSGMAFFYISAVLVGLGLGMLLGAPLRYVMLNETPASERASGQGILALDTSIGQLMGAALVGAVASSTGGGAPGYLSAFLVIGGIMVVMAALTFALKGRHAEMATASEHHAAARQAPKATSEG
ncbi:MAG: MFS transporter, partial [Rudaea sp.]